MRCNVESHVETLSGKAALPQVDVFLDFRTHYRHTLRHVCVHREWCRHLYRLGRLDSDRCNLFLIHHALHDRIWRLCAGPKVSFLLSC